MPQKRGRRLCRRGIGERGPDQRQERLCQIRTDVLSVEEQVGRRQTKRRRKVRDVAPPTVDPEQYPVAEKALISDLERVREDPAVAFAGVDGVVTTIVSSAVTVMASASP